MFFRIWHRDISIYRVKLSRVALLQPIMQKGISVCNYKNIQRGLFKEGLDLLGGGGGNNPHKNYIDFLFILIFYVSLQ